MSQLPESKRLFVAIPFVPDASFADKWQRLRRCTNKTDRAVWVNPSLFHLTVKFLGETDAARLPEISRALAKVTARCEAFSLLLDKVGAFGSRYCPRVLWLGTERLPEGLLRLHKETDAALARLGFPPTFGNFVCHLTMARIQRIESKNFFWEQVEACNGLFSERVEAKEIVLYESVLRKDCPPQYLVCGRFPLP